jgi:hypothetical protein
MLTFGVPLIWALRELFVLRRDNRGGGWHEPAPDPQRARRHRPLGSGRCRTASSRSRWPAPPARCRNWCSAARQAAGRVSGAFGPWYSRNITPRRRVHPGGVHQRIRGGQGVGLVARRHARHTAPTIATTGQPPPSSAPRRCAGRAGHPLRLPPVAAHQEWRRTRPAEPRQRILLPQHWRSEERPHTRLRSHALPFTAPRRVENPKHIEANVRTESG